MATINQQYDELQKKYNQDADNAAARQKAAAQVDYNKKLKEAYITNMQNQRQLNQNLQKSGIRGGATETSNLGLMNSYANQRGALGGQYAQTVRDIDVQTEANKNSYAQNITSSKIQYQEQLEAEQRAYAREDKLKAQEDRIANLTAVYSKSYDVKKLKKALAKAKTAEEKRVINLRIGFLTAHKKGY